MVITISLIISAIIFLSGAFSSAPPAIEEKNSEFSTGTAFWYPAHISEEKIDIKNFFDKYIRDNYPDYGDESGGLAADNVFVNENYGWKMIYLDCGAGQCAIALYKTSNGGANWTAIGDSGKINRTVLLGGHKTGISFRDENTGWVGVSIPSDVSEMYKSTDGGFSWETIVMPMPENENIYQTITHPPSFFNEKDGIAFSQITSDSSSRNKLVVFVTHDGGESWEYSDKLASENGNLKWDFSEYNSRQENAEWPDIKGSVKTGKDVYTIADGLLNWNKK